MSRAHSTRPRTTAMLRAPGPVPPSPAELSSTSASYPKAGVGEGQGLPPRRVLPGVAELRNGGRGPWVQQTRWAAPSLLGAGVRLTSWEDGPRARDSRSHGEGAVRPDTFECQECRFKTKAPGESCPRCGENKPWRSICWQCAGTGSVVPGSGAAAQGYLRSVCGICGGTGEWPSR